MMRGILVALFLLLGGAAAQAQTSFPLTPSTGGGCGSACLKSSNNLSDLTSQSNGRANTFPVTQRDPKPSDYLGYSVGSLWHGTSGWWIASRQTASTGETLWTRLPQQQIAATPLAVYGTSAIYVNSSGVRYTGNLFDLTRMSDLTTQTFAAVSAGLPDTAAMAIFCANTICRYTKDYDQTGGGNHATQTTAFSWAPRWDGTVQSNGAPGMVLDYSAQNVFATATTLYPVSSYTTGPNTITLTTAPTYPVEPGWTVTGANIPTASSITGTISTAGGGTLTTTAVTGTMAAGQVLYGAPVPNTTLVALQSGSGNAQVWTVSQSQTVSSATTFKANTIVTSVNAAGTQLTLSAAPTGTASVVIVANNVGLDIPSGVSISAFNAHSAFVVATSPSEVTDTPYLVLGDTGLQPNNASTYSGIFNTAYEFGAIPNGAAYISGGAGNSCAATNPGWFFGGKVQVIGYNRGSNFFDWYLDGLSGARTGTGCQPTSAISGGSIGYSQQSYGTQRGGDYVFYAAVIYNRTLSAAEVTSTQQGLTTAFVQYPQILQQIAYDGSSTTSGTGTDYTNSQPNKTSQLISSYYPNIAINEPTGGTVETMNTQYPFYAGADYVAGLTPILVVHPGLGNSLQASGSATVTAGGSTTVMSVTTVNTDLMTGSYVTGTGTSCTLPRTQILAATPTTVTLAAAPPSCTITTLTLTNDCGTEVWANIVTYLQAARASGYKIVLVGSASRGTFTTSGTCPGDAVQVQEYQTAKALMFNHWPQYADAYVDLQDDPAFGDAAAGGAMTVTGVSGNVVTVSSVSSDAAVGSYVKFIGMPDYAVTITAISGNSITLSVSPPTRLATLNAINIAPWTANPTYWLQIADQHFLDLGYEAHAHMIAPAVLGLLPSVSQ